MDKFNNYLLEYYKEILSELNFLGILKKFTSSMDIKKLYPLLDYPENNKYFKSDFRNLIIEGKNLTEKDYYEFSLYDSIISTILNSSIFENLDKMGAVVKTERRGNILHGQLAHGKKLFGFLNFLVQDVADRTKAGFPDHHPAKGAFAHRTAFGNNRNRQRCT